MKGSRMPSGFRLVLILVLSAALIACIYGYVSNLKHTGSELEAYSVTALPAAGSAGSPEALPANGIANSDTASFADPADPTDPAAISASGQADSGAISAADQTDSGAISASSPADTDVALSNPGADSQSEAVSDTVSAEVTIFIAASLENTFRELIAIFNKTYPHIAIICNADSSGTLLAQIREGASCDLFFSAATSQMDSLESSGLVVDGSRINLLRNELVLIAGKGNGTNVTSLSDIEKARSFALAGGSVPAGKYTRKALIALGKLDPAADPALIESSLIQEKLGVEINECSNVSKVKEAVKEEACEAGTVYLTDAYSIIDQVDILEHVSTDLTGDIIYPVALVKNKDADDAESEAARLFYSFITSKEAVPVYEKYLYIVNTDNLR